jgi:hypothetical protein
LLLLQHRISNAQRLLQRMGLQRAPESLAVATPESVGFDPASAASGARLAGVELASLLMAIASEVLVRRLLAGEPTLPPTVLASRREFAAASKLAAAVLTSVAESLAVALKSLSLCDGAGTLQAASG